MGIVADSVLDLGGSVPIATEDDLDRLRELAIERAACAATQMNTTIEDCLDKLDRFAEHEPDPSDVRERLGDHELGCWRLTIEISATLATLAHLEAQVEDDLAIIRMAIDEAEDAGFEPVAILTTCAHASIPHASETGLAGGTLYSWIGPSGTRHDSLKVTLTDNLPVWVELAVRPEVKDPTGRTQKLTRLAMLPTETAGSLA